MTVASTLSLADYLLANCTKTDTCWLWKSHGPSNKYGEANHRGMVYKAHKAAYIAFIGPIPDKLWVLHTCDVPHCINPAHLYAGTRADNNRDMANRKRAHRNIGNKNGNAVLTEEQVRQIKGLLRSFNSSVSKTKATGIVAKLFKVSTPTIQRIQAGTSWSHVK